ncbi:MAG: hypothetical protein FWG68_01925, partial [Defluviitaleaceae bacterium]|nr:hypothetical protein [Defluviitaleaceae bacterium]
GRPYNNADRRGDRPLPARQAGRSPVRLIPNGSIKVYAGGATVSYNKNKSTIRKKRCLTFPSSTFCGVTTKN